MRNLNEVIFIIKLRPGCLETEDGHELSKLMDGTVLGSSLEHVEIHQSASLSRQESLLHG